MIITPTVGRVVWYRPGPVETTLVHLGDQPCEAHVVAVHGDRCVNIVGWDANGTFFFRSSARLLQDGDSPDFEGQSYCEWMPYQKGQAAKYDALEKQQGTS